MTLSKFKKPYIIAETACSHDGSLRRLKFLIKAANKSKANAIQFQVWQSQNISTPKHKNYKYLKSIELSKKQWRECFKYTKKNFPKLEIIACIYDVETLKFCKELGADAFKIHSSDLGNENLLRETAKIKKRIDLSVGGSKNKEIKSALEIIGKKCPVWLMYGYQLFPTKPGLLKILKIKYLINKFKLEVGYQDHSPPNIFGYTAPVLAIGKGITIIEKHITDDRSRKGTDSEAALEPKEFFEFVNQCKTAFSTLKKINFNNLTKEEILYRKYSKKKIFFSKDLKRGNILNISDFLIRQPIKEKGLTVDNLQKLIGKKINKNVKKYQIVEKKHFK